MKKLLAAILFCLGGFAHAQQPCLPGFYGTVWPGSSWVGPTSTDNGWYSFAFCDAGGGRMWPRYSACAHGECLSQEVIGATIGRLLIMVRLGADKVKTFENARVADFTCGTLFAPFGGVTPYEPPAGPTPLPPPLPGSGREKICMEVAAAMQAKWPMAAPPPPPPPASAPPLSTHVVKANGTFTTRPAYDLIGTTRGAKEVARATVGQPCDLTKPTLASGSDVWAQFGPNFVSPQVALCSKR